MLDATELEIRWGRFVLLGGSSAFWDWTPFLQTMQPCLPHSAGRGVLEGPTGCLLCSEPVQGPGGSKAFSRDHLGRKLMTWVWDISRDRGVV